jgi:DNA-binding transcriptional MerR regulator
MIKQPRAAGDLKKLLSIKEFSELSGIEQTTLRYWDEIGLFHPAMRNAENNYRCYSHDQIILINYITVLSGLNIPLKTIGDVSEVRSPEKIMELIDQQEIKMDRELVRLREAYSVMHTLRGLIRTGLNADESAISVCTMEEMPMILGQRNVFGEEGRFLDAFTRFCQQAKQMRINLSYPVGGQFESMGAFLQSPSQPQHFFSADPMGYDHSPAGEYLVGYQRGNYGDMGDMPGRLEAYVQEHAITTTGPVSILYLHDEICTSDPSKYLAQVRVRIEKH